MNKAILGVGYAFCFRLEHTSVLTGRGLFLMGGEFSPNTTEILEPDFGDFVASFSLLPGRISHCSIQVGIFLTLEEHLNKFKGPEFYSHLNI